MAKRILVPLDQAPDAEAVLPLVADAARSAGATVRLLHVAPVPGHVEDQDGHVVAYADQETARLEAEAMDYLRAVEARLDGIPVEAVVRFGDAADEILLAAEAFGADLIAMTTARRTPISRLILGSTAQQVCRRAPGAVVIYRAGER